MDNFKKVPLIESSIHEVSTRLFAYDKNKVLELGTCVLIAKDFAITAKHVVEEAIKQFPKNDDGSIDVNFWTCRIFPGPEYAIWSIEATWLSHNTDLAFLRLKPYNNIAVKNPFTKQVMIDLIPPSVGDKVVGFGYSGRLAKSKFKIDKSRNPDMEINSKPFTTIGLVEEIYPEKRDNLLLSFPSFRIGFKSEPGMSGGPVFNNKTGNLVGIISRGWDGQEMANACLIWPSVITQINLNGKSQTIFDYMEKGIIGSVGRERIRIVPQFSFLYKK